MRDRLPAFLISLCLSVGAMLACGAAPAAVGIDIQVAPPAPMVEVVPAPRPGFVWAPGFWEWRGTAHVWVPGRWIAARPGFYWVPDRWVLRGGYWHYYPGHWAR